MSENRTLKATSMEQFRRWYAKAVRNRRNEVGVSPYESARAAWIAARRRPSNKTTA